MPGRCLSMTVIMKGAMRAAREDRGWHLLAWGVAACHVGAMLPRWALSWFRAAPHQREGHALYVAAVAAARRPVFYEGFGVPDTLDGRFDCVGLHVFLVIRQLWKAPAPGPELAQAVFDAMFGDMDRSLREIGVGDLSVPKRNRRMWEAFHGRALAYGEALDAGDEPALAAAIARNVWRGREAGGGPALLAAYARRADVALAGQVAELHSGRVVFPEVEGGDLAAGEFERRA
jgi:cytochrome b pre-mRNA-processing protein 3